MNDAIKYYRRLLQRISRLNKEKTAALLKEIADVLAKSYEEEINDAVGFRDLYFGDDAIEFYREHFDDDFLVDGAPYTGGISTSEEPITHDTILDFTYAYDAYDGIFFKPKEYLEFLFETYEEGLSDREDELDLITYHFIKVYPELKDRLDSFI